MRGEGDEKTKILQTLYKYVSALTEDRRTEPKSSFQRSPWLETADRAQSVLAPLPILPIYASRRWARGSQGLEKDLKGTPVISYNICSFFEHPCEQLIKEA